MPIETTPEAISAAIAADFEDTPAPVSATLARRMAHHKLSTGRALLVADVLARDLEKVLLRADELADQAGLPRICQGLKR